MRPLLVLLFLAAGQAGCVFQDAIDPSAVVPADVERGAVEVVAEGETHYTLVAKGSDPPVARREGDGIPTFLLPYRANVTVEIAWTSAAAAPEIRALIGHTQDRDVLAQATGPSPLVLQVEGAKAGEYAIVIDPADDPGVLSDQTFLWTVRAERLPEIAPATNETLLGTFTRGLVFFSFTPTGPDHEVWSRYDSTEIGAMIYMTGHWTLGGPRADAVTVQGSGFDPVRFQTEPSDGGGGHKLRVQESRWNQTYWIVFAAANASGPSPIRVGITGKDFRLDAAPVEADASLFTEDDWSGALDARAGRGDPGATVVASRSLPVATTRGTLLFYDLGDSGNLRAEDVTLTNATTTLRWTGASYGDAGVDVDRPGNRHGQSTFMCFVAPAGSWELSIGASARVGGWPDYVLVSDVELPDALARAV